AVLPAVAPPTVKTTFFPPTFARRDPQETKKRADEPVKARRRVSFNFFSNAAAFAVRKLDAFPPCLTPETQRSPFR
ncbi:MAG: hypothetical protein IIW01_00650, partial [Thermoguttaceae bacterium]|nr:hypothetical protein [Thermoguttaceae bacterium]